MIKPHHLFVGATAPRAYAQAFDEKSAPVRPEPFASVNGARFYGRKPNRERKCGHDVEPNQRKRNDRN
jgi:dihydroorotase